MDLDVEEPVADSTEALEEKKPVQTFTREDLVKARQQEKDKLYPELQKLREQVSSLTSAQEAAEAKRKQEEQEAAEAAKRKQEEEMDVRSLLTKKEQEWQDQLRQEREERERMAALFEKERQFSALQQYRTRRMQEESENILPELIDLISGNNQEEIESSINGLKMRTERILESTREATQQLRRESVGTRITAPPADNPLDNYSGQKQWTPEEIAAMSVDEYAKYRSSFLGKGSGSGRGIFG